MFHVTRYTGFHAQGTTVGVFSTKAAAEAAAREAASAFQSSGFDEEQGYWWGRNDGELTVRFLVMAK